MENSGAALAAAVEATVFLGYFNEMPDHRQAGKVAYPLDEVLLLALMAVLAGAEGRGGRGISDRLLRWIT